MATLNYKTLLINFTIIILLYFDDNGIRYIFGIAWNILCYVGHFDGPRFNESLHNEGGAGTLQKRQAFASRLIYF